MGSKVEKENKLIFKNNNPCGYSTAHCATISLAKINIPIS